MTERKPRNVSWESWVEGQIRLSMEQGEFDDLPGKGKPLAGLDEPYDEMWWVREKLKRENVSYLPPALEVRRELDQTRRAIAATTHEAAVRELVGRINERIRYVNSHVVEGPPSTLMPLDVDEEVEQWRRIRPAPAPEPAGEQVVEPTTPRPRRTGVQVALLLLGLVVLGVLLASATLRP